LKSLESLNNLESLYISNTDIDDGVEFLPKSITEIYYSTKSRPESKVKNIEKELD